MQSARTQAQILLAGERSALACSAAGLLKPLKTNFVERPWGGVRIRDFKGLCPLPDQVAVTGAGLGEAFEIAAFDEDAEARQYPSRLRFVDGSEVSLAELLSRHSDELLGPQFVSRYGGHIPLLPKTLDIKELLSVQGHPEGNTEVYIIIDAEPGATIRLGFSRDIDSGSFQAELSRGRQQQESLVSAFGDAMSPGDLQVILGPWMAQPDSPASALEVSLRQHLAGAESWSGVAALLSELKALYWRVLDCMNAIPVVPGQVIHNANPQRIVRGTGKAPSAEVHALGNPEGREILALEIRRPGPTFRAWDNVRFPIREIDVASAINALNLSRTEIDEFIVEPEPVGGRPGILCSVDSDAFRLEHLRPEPGESVEVLAEPPHCLHAIGGRARFSRSAEAVIGELEQGESALVPVGVGAYRVEALEPNTEVIKVGLPFGA